MKHTSQATLEILFESGLLKNIPDGFAEAVNEWLNAWMMKGDDSHYAGSSDVKAGHEKDLLIKRLNELFKNKQFVDELTREVKDYENKYENSILNSNLLVFGDVKLGHTIIINSLGNQARLENTVPLVKKMKELISSARISEAIKLATELTKFECINLHNPVLIIAAAYKSLERREMIGAISFGNASISRAEIIDQFLKILDEISVCLNTNSKE